MSTQQTTVLQSISDEDRLTILLDAFQCVTDTMRYHEVEKFGHEIGILFALVTGNHQLINKMHTCNTSISSKYQQEMKEFVKNRIIFLVNSVIERIKIFTQIKAIENDSLKPTIKIGNFEFNRSEFLTLHDFQHLEYEIDKVVQTACTRRHDDVEVHDGGSSYKRLDFETSNIAVFASHDLLDILHFLLRQFENLELLQREGASYLNKITNRSDEDISSIRCIVILANMIAKVVLAIHESNPRFNHLTPSEKRKIQFELVVEEYRRMINLGAFSFSSIICCFKNMSLLQEAISNKDGKAGQREREFLIDILILDKLT